MQLEETFPNFQIVIKRTSINHFNSKNKECVSNSSLSCFESFEWVSVRNKKFKRGNVILTEILETGPIFGSIHLILKEGKKTFLVYDQFRYDEQYCAYKIAFSGDVKCIYLTQLFSEILDPLPYLYTEKNNVKLVNTRIIL